MTGSEKESTEERIERQPNAYRRARVGGPARYK